MHKSIVFNLKHNVDIFCFAEFSPLVIQKNWEILDENSLKYQNEIIYFDYLITDQLEVGKILKLEKQDKKLITNYFLQTNLENIYALGEATNCLAPLSEQLLRIYEDITTK